METLRIVGERTTTFKRCLYLKTFEEDQFEFVGLMHNFCMSDAQFL